MADDGWPRIFHQDSQQSEICFFTLYPYNIPILFIAGSHVSPLFYNESSKQVIPYLIEYIFLDLAAEDLLLGILTKQTVAHPEINSVRSSSWNFDC